MSAKRIGAKMKADSLPQLLKMPQKHRYRPNPRELKPMHDYERFWTHQITRIEERAKRRAREQTASPTTLIPRKEDTARGGVLTQPLVADRDQRD